MYVTKKSRVLKTIRSQSRKSKIGVTAHQIAKKLNINKDSVYSAVSQLRTEGHTITKTVNRDGYVSYSIV